MYNLSTKKIKKILEYTGQGMPIIKDEEIVYSKNRKIYSFSILDRTENYLFDGELPFDYDGKKIYYLNNNQIMIWNKQTGEKKTLKNIGEIGGKPLKIANDIYGILKLKIIDDKLYEEYTELELIDIENNGKLNFYNLYYKNINKKYGKFPYSTYPFLVNTSFMFIDKKILKDYVDNNN